MYIYYFYKWKTSPTRLEKKSCPLPERLASLGRMGAQLRDSLKPLNTIVCCDVPKGFRGCPDRRQPLGRCCLIGIVFPAKNSEIFHRIKVGQVSNWPSWQ